MFAVVASSVIGFDSNYKLAMEAFRNWRFLSCLQFYGRRVQYSGSRGWTFVFHSDTILAETKERDDEQTDEANPLPEKLCRIGLLLNSLPR